MKQSLNLKLSQQLTLTPQLKQSLLLLQLPAVDLEKEIQKNLDSNPLLERVQQEMSTPDSKASGDLAADNGLPQPIAESADPSFEIEQTDHLAAEQNLAANLQESFESKRVSNNMSNSGNSAAEFTQFVSKQETLFEHLDWQIQMTTLSPKDKLIAASILHSLDDDGFLNATNSEIVDTLDAELLVDEDEVEAVLNLIKTLEPVGCGARNLSERLLLLLAQFPATQDGVALAKQIVADHLEMLASRKLVELRKALNVTEEQLSTSLEIITHLNPRIANQYSSDNENYVVPDLIVKKVAGRWVALLNPDNESRLKVNDTYRDMLKRDIDQEGSKYIQENLAQAKMFIKSLMSRYDTLLLVGQAVVDQQQAFFEHGDEHMQAMILQDIAALLELHESTISRATSGKYLLSPRGVYELKYFFSSALSTTDGATSSSTAIRSLIKKLIDNEPKSKPLSDSKLVKELEKQGHVVARRTVAKYRESMQIAPSSKRKALV